MWLRVEDSILDHDGLRLAARRMACSYGDALLMLMRVWRALYKRGGATMTTEEIDTIAGRDGFADQIIAPGVELAVVDPGGIRMLGSDRAEKYGAYRLAQKANSELAVAAKKASVLPETFSGASVPIGTNEVPLGIPLGSPLGYPDGNPVLDLSGSGSSGVRSPDQSKLAAQAWVEWFNRKFGRQMRANTELVKMVRGLMVRGYTEKPDMRGVALYLRAKWGDDEKMREHLVPSTILRPTKFAERLDLAKEWSPDLWAGDEA